MGVLCAFLVVLIHCYVPSETWSGFWWFTEIVGGGEWLHGCFIRCAVPYFFLAAGFFLAGHVAHAVGFDSEGVASDKQIGDGERAAGVTGFDLDRLTDGAVFPVWTAAPIELQGVGDGIRRTCPSGYAHAPAGIPSDVGGSS